MIGYFLVIIAQLSYALGALILKKHLEKVPALYLSLFSLGLGGAFSFAILVLVMAGVISIPSLYLVRSEFKHLFTLENLPWVILYALLFVFLGEVLLIMGYIKGKSLIILSFSVLFYPLFTSMFSLLILKEGLTLKTILGGVSWLSDIQSW